MLVATATGGPEEVLTTPPALTKRKRKRREKKNEDKAMQCHSLITWSVDELQIEEVVIAHALEVVDDMEHIEVDVADWLWLWRPSPRREV